MQTIININKIPQNGIVILDFWAGWCVGCKAIAPQIEALAEKEKDCQFFKIDADAFPELLTQYHIRSLPTVIVLKDGKELERETTKDGCTNLIQKFSVSKLSN